MPETETLEKTEVKKPSMYNVIFKNDDYTPMNFVVEILCEIFHKNSEEAYNIMISIHENGKGIAGTYTREIAQQKVNESINIARKYEYPLNAYIEKE